MNKKLLVNNSILVLLLIMTITICCGCLSTDKRNLIKAKEKSSEFCNIYYNYGGDVDTEVDIIMGKIKKYFDESYYTEFITPDFVSNSNDSGMGVGININIDKKKYFKKCNITIDEIVTNKVNDNYVTVVGFYLDLGEHTINRINPGFIVITMDNKFKIINIKEEY